MSNNRDNGNVALMRETLKEVEHSATTIIECLQHKRGPVFHIAKNLIAVVQSVLATPPRNCDLYANELDAQLAFLNDVWLISVNKNTMLETDKFENWTEEMKTRYGRWLLATAELKVKTK